MKVVSFFSVTDFQLPKQNVAALVLTLSPTDTVLQQQMTNISSLCSYMEQKSAYDDFHNSPG